MYVGHELQRQGRKKDGRRGMENDDKVREKLVQDDGFTVGGGLKFALQEFGGLLKSQVLWWLFLILSVLTGCGILYVLYRLIF
jgi:hypothetical protein